MRLQKFMAHAGVASRRKCEEHIAQGRVEVNGQTVREPGYIVDPAVDRVKFMGKPVSMAGRYVYIMLNKPAGCVSTCNDEKGRDTVMRYVKDVSARLYPVGRLDFTSEGLLLLTNDGELANRLTHPRHRIEKKYLAVTDGPLDAGDLDKLAAGVVIDGKKTAPAVFKLLKTSPARSEALCVIAEGKNRQLRKMFDAIGKNVVYLKRVAVGGLKLGNLKKGQYRHLTDAEVAQLKK
jgi:23S rRNA pseudouridine2605 synthase